MGKRGLSDENIEHFSFGPDNDTNIRYIPKVSGAITKYDTSTKAIRQILRIFITKTQASEPRLSDYAVNETF